jgi:hypothetical protein
VSSAPEELWRTFRASPRPIKALLDHVVTHDDYQAELARLVKALSPEEASELMPLIRHEWQRRRFWWSRPLVDPSTLNKEDDR